MTWVYGSTAVVFFGLGSYWVLGDLPPHEGLMYPGLEFYLGLYFFAIPGALNLLNLFLGPRLAVIRWGLVPVNLLLVAFHILWLKEADADYLLLLTFVAGAAALLALSFLLARTWGKADKDPQEVG